LAGAQQKVMPVIGFLSRDRARLNEKEEPAGSSRLPSSASADQPPPPSARTPSWVLFGDEILGLEILEPFSGPEHAEVSVDPERLGARSR
jgi:hypothetical protein